MKFFAYRNNKINCLLGTTSGGEWCRVSPFRWFFLWLFGYYVKIESSEKTIYERFD